MRVKQVMVSLGIFYKSVFLFWTMNFLYVVSVQELLLSRNHLMSFMLYIYRFNYMFGKGCIMYMYMNYKYLEVWYMLKVRREQDNEKKIRKRLGVWLGRVKCTQALSNIYFSKMYFDLPYLTSFKPCPNCHCYC